jgi:hypothetical protein
VVFIFGKQMEVTKKVKNKSKDRRQTHKQTHRQIDIQADRQIFEQAIGHIGKYTNRSSTKSNFDASRNGSENLKRKEEIFCFKI